MRDENDYFSLFQHCVAGIIHTDTDQRITMANKAAYKLLGCDSEEQLKGRTLFSLHLDSSHQELFDFYLEKTLLKDKTLTLDYPFKKVTGEVVWFNISGVSLGITQHSSTNQGIVWTLVDISSRKEMEDKLTVQSNTDYLTGVSNRRHFMQAADKQLSAHKRHKRILSALMLDIDHFKRINDTFGHSTGDDVIRAFTDTCQKNLRREDLLGRLGGEEFAVLLPETSLSRALLIAQRIRKKVEKESQQHNRPAITVSIGLAELREGDHVDDLLNRADEALFAAKHAGRNQVKCAG